MRWRSLLLPGLVALAALAVLLGLGTWQLERLAWKNDLLARIEARAYGEPGAIPPESAWDRFSPEEDEYRRVRLTGTFLHDRETAVHGLMSASRGQPVQGYYILTPLRLPDGAIVVVNRGFVPTERRDPATRPEGQIPGETSVTGLLRRPEERTAFVPENAPAREDWFTRDPAAIAAARGLARVAPFIVDADAAPVPGGLPRGGQTVLRLVNNHLQYALTWYGIALTLLGVFAAFAWRRLRGADDAPPQAERRGA
ncbi:SURF1 family protein [Salinarimonas soli]|uniref:SURF1-like protein n=1 Tax=Salinarimonas soli TaxID=1638099 RepID=A0A5B2V563_9HYPH|nr:SURF1 family protein [Salinarimonas soli]KAA2234104.1 SURF1 family protein [Salinarimonas soli]